MPFVIEYLRNRRVSSWQREYSTNATHIEAAGALIGVGNPFPDERKLEDLPCSSLALWPHVSRRGPNGLWEIRRGPNHPLELAFADIGAYVHRRANGDLEIVAVRNAKTAWRDEARMIDLFVSKQAAEQAAAEPEELDEEDGVPSVDCFRVDYVQGSALLEAVSHADILSVECGDDAKLLSLTTTGERIVTALGEPGIEATSASIIQALTYIDQ